MSADSADRITFKLLTESYSRHLNCEVCGKLMIDPRRLHPCADTFCLHCIDKNLKKCPKCHLVIRAVQIDMTAAGLID